MSSSMMRGLGQLERSSSYSGTNIVELIEKARAEDGLMLRTMSADDYQADRAQRTAARIAALKAKQEDGYPVPLERQILAGLERVLDAGLA